jgi:hypothetical protein
MCDHPQERGRREAAEGDQRPDAHRHGGAPFEDTQHVEEAGRAAEVGDQQRRRDEGSRERHGQRRPHEGQGLAREQAGQREHAAHPGRPANEEVQADLPRPHGALTIGCP